MTEPAPAHAPALSFTPPQQRRSEETLHRIAEAARSLLTRKRFREITLGELTREAGVTVGAFYTRFRSKSDLLEYLERDMRTAFRGGMSDAPASAFTADSAIRNLADEDYDSLLSEGTAVFGTSPPMEVSIGEVLRHFIRHTTEAYRTHKGVLRELVMRSRSDDDRQARRVDMMREVAGMASDWLLKLSGSIQHPNAPRALRIALLFATSALRDVILFDEQWQSPGDEPLSLDVLQEEIVRAVTAYLGLPAEST